MWYFLRQILTSVLVIDLWFPHCKLNCLRKISFLVSFTFSLYHIQCHSDKRSSMHICWMIQKWDYLLNWMSYWNHHYFQECYFLFSCLCSFFLRVKESRIMNSSVIRKAMWMLLGLTKTGRHSDNDWSTEMGPTDGKECKINVLNTHVNCGLHINRYEKVKVSFNF